MRRLFWAAAAALLAGLSAEAQDFEKAWAGTEFAAKAGADMYGGAIRPVWTGEDTFVFEADEPSGKVW